MPRFARRSSTSRLMSNSLKVSEVLNNLGGVFYDKGLLEEAIKRMLWPSRVGLWRPSSITTLRDQHALSQGPCQPGRYEDGIKELEQALTPDPNYAGAHINLGSILAYLGQTERALLHYPMALQSGDERARGGAVAGINQLRSRQ